MSNNATKSPGRQAKPAGRGSPQTPIKAISRQTPAKAFRSRAAKALSKLSEGVH